MIKSCMTVIDGFNYSAGSFHSASSVLWPICIVLSLYTYHQVNLSSILIIKYTYH